MASEIIAILAENPEGLSSSQILKISNFTGSYRSLRRLLASMAEGGLIAKTGEKRGRRYFPAGLANNSDNGQLMAKGYEGFSPKNQNAPKKPTREIDAYRIKFRKQRKRVMGLVVKNGLHGPKAEDYIESFCAQNSIPNPAKFIAMTLADLSILHDGTIVGLGITVKQLDAWLSERS